MWASAAAEFRERNDRLPETLLDRLLERPEDGVELRAPAALDLVLDPGSTFWLRLPQPNPKSEEWIWRVLDNAGEWLTDVRLPARFSLLVVDGDRLYGVTRDEFDVETVVAFRVNRGAGG